MKLLINFALTLTALAYPLIWWFFGQGSPILAFLPYLLAGLWAIKALQAVGFLKFFANAMAAILLIVGLTRSLDTMYWYPVMMNGVMLATFGGSLFTEQSVVERLARLQQPDLPERAVRYTRNVTLLWCGVFVLNIVVSALLILLEKFDLWAIYTGVVAYAIMAVVMGGEWWFRKIVIRR